MLNMIKFSYLFPAKSEVKMGMGLHYVLIGLAVVMIPIIIWSDQFVISVIDVEGWGYETKLGHYYIYYGLVVLTSILILIRNIIYKFKRSTGRDRIQLVILSFGTLLFGISVSVLDIVIPILYGTSKYFFLSPATGIFYIGAVAYAILKLRFFDVRLVIRRIITILYVGLLSVGFYLLIIYLTDRAFGSVFTRESLIIACTATLLINSIFTPAREYFREKIAPKIIRTDYDPVKVRDHFIDQLSTRIDIREIISISTETFKGLFNLGDCRMVVYRNKEGEKVIYMQDKNSKNFNYKSVLEKIKKVHRTVIIRGEMVNLDYNNELNKAEEEILEFMNKEELGVIVYQSIESKFEGLFFLGEKVDRSVFTTTDVDLLKSLSNYISLAVSRAFLYEEIQDFNKTLKQKIDKKTKQLKQKFLELKEVQKRERDMLDILGHELRTPLSIIKSALGLIKMRGKGKDFKYGDVKKYVEKGEESVKREVNIVENMLSATKISSDQVTFNYDVIDMIDVIKDSIDGNIKKAKDKNLFIKFDKLDGPDKSFRSYGDRTATQRIMDNLLSNAVKYTDKGGITIKINNDDDFVTISVQDTGKGISKEDIKKLGQKFYRVDQYTEDRRKKVKMVRPGGTGIGLYVVYGLVKKMNGKIWFESEVGKGSTFYFSLQKYTGQKINNRKDKEVDIFKRRGLKN